MRPCAHTGSGCTTYAGMSALEIYYSHVDVAEIMDFVDKRARPYLASTVKAATHHDALAAFAKLTAVDETGALHLVDHPPTMFHSPLVEQADPHYALRHYRSTLQEDRRALLDRTGWWTRRSRSSGSVPSGSAPVVVLMLEGASGAPLFLQVKEAEASVLERFLSKSPFDNHGERVVAGQRRLQAASDILLGWTKGRLGRHVYVRQLHDQKGSAVLEAMTAATTCRPGRSSVAGHWREGTPAPVIRPRSPHTSATTTPSTTPSATLPSRTRTRPSATTRPSWRPSRPAGSRRSRASDPAGSG